MSGKWVWKQTPKKDTVSQRRYSNYRANPAHYMIDDSHARKYAAAAKAQAKKAAEARARAAAAEQRKKDGIFGNIMKGNFSTAWQQTKSGLHDTFGTWEGWKTRVLPGMALAACIVVSAGLCTIAGAAVVGATFIGDGLTTGSWNYAAAGKGLAWTLAGGGAARLLAGSWKGSALAYRTRVKSVHQAENVTIYGYRRTIDAGATYANVSLNTGLAASFCGAGKASPWNVAGVC
ncbi:hypothetical protein ACF07L_33845 [Streptomyces anulatus]|uniref:hypothetical protein n=1 Tax=Streptomyces anulatus TaxID=1892 RepID=UPI0036F9287C